MQLGQGFQAQHGASCSTTKGSSSIAGSGGREPAAAGLKLDGGASSIGIITPYRAMVLQLKEELRGIDGVEVNTVDAFQVCCHAQHLGIWREQVHSWHILWQNSSLL
jgi:hypothetical protein